MYSKLYFCLEFILILSARDEIGDIFFPVFLIFCCKFSSLTVVKTTKINAVKNDENTPIH